MKKERSERRFIQRSYEDFEMNRYGLCLTTEETELTRQDHLMLFRYSD